MIDEETKEIERLEELIKRLEPEEKEKRLTMMISFITFNIDTMI